MQIKAEKLSSMAGLGQFAYDIICQQVVVFARSVGLCRDRTARVAGFPETLWINGICASSGSFAVPPTFLHPLFRTGNNGFRAVRPSEPGHVFDESQDGDVDFVVRNIAMPRTTSASATSAAC